METQPQRSASGGATPRPPRAVRRRWLRPLAFAVMVAVAAGGTTVAALGSDDGSRYRTATAEIRDVAQVMDEVGTVEPVSQASVSFGSSGTVGTVDVAEGDEVKVGDALATLDPESLNVAVRQAQAALDAAELTLERALAGEDISTGGTSPTGTGEGDVVGASATDAVHATLGSQSPGEQPTGRESSSDDAALRAAQQEVLDAQRQVDADMQAAGAVLATAESICAALGEESPTSSTTSTSSTTRPTSTTSSTSTSTTSTPEDDDGSSDVDACYQALEDVLAAQRTLSDSQTALSEAARALDELLAELAARAGGDDDVPDAPNEEPPSGTGADPSATPGPSPDGDGTGGPGGDGSESSSYPSSEQLIAYQKAVDAASADLLAAQHAVDNNSIVSPIAGKVTSVGMQPGDEVDAGSDTAAIVVAGDGGYEVTVSIPVTDLLDIEIGQPVEVIPDGLDDTLAGQVTGIAAVPSSASGSTAYNVTISLDDGTNALRNGSVAAVRITTGETTESVAVPTSAVRVNNGQHSIQVVDGADVTEVPVEIEAIGTTWTAVTDGVEEGDVVVLADLDQPLPTSATDSEGAGRNGPFGRGEDSFEPGPRIEFAPGGG